MPESGVSTPGPATSGATSLCEGLEGLLLLVLAALVLAGLFRLLPAIAFGEVSSNEIQLSFVIVIFLQFDDAFP